LNSRAELAAPSSERPLSAFEQVLHALSTHLASPQATHALLLVDVQDPLKLQAQLGFRASAALMSALSHEFETAVGARGAVLRLGETSFCVVVHGVRNQGHALLAAEKLYRAADHYLSAQTESLKPALHFGIALYPRDATEPEALVRKAQLASAAARSRSERAVVYDEGCGEHVLKPAQLGLAFAEALESGALSVHYQPKIRIDSGAVAGVEALMRWLAEGRPVATPDVFIPLAEEARLMNDVTWFALSNAVRTSDAIGDLNVAVNVSAGMLHHREFVEMMETAVQTWRIKPGRLTLELTEGALVADFAQATARLRRVRELGVRVSIDDFGTGYSSLSYFKKIPADEIKIDKSFVLRMIEDQADQRMVEAILSLARQFDLEVVAEGVENRETLDLLARLGCDYAQGYLFAAAMDEERLREWLSAAASGR
jgi:EAL domain-containing protein (putative c-di-GMP-specific phosphodiesterase class I)/GGDEF domain-containing protein